MNSTAKLKVKIVASSPLGQVLHFGIVTATNLALGRPVHGLYPLELLVFGGVLALSAFIITAAQCCASCLTDGVVVLFCWRRK